MKHYKKKKVAITDTGKYLVETSIARMTIKNCESGWKWVTEIIKRKDIRDA